MTGYDANAADLTGHASTLYTLADELRAAVGAGQVTLTDNALGQAGRQVTDALNAVARAGQDALRAATGSLESVSATLRANVQTYADQDNTVSGAVRGIAGGLR